MAHLSLCTLGPLQATLDGQPVTGLKSDKVRALLAYLAAEVHRVHRREALAGLLWPDLPDRAARSNLRGALSNLRQATDDRTAVPPFLLVTRETIQFNVDSDHWLDATVLREQIAAHTAHTETLDPPATASLAQAVDLYQGSFLEAFSVDSAPFEEWVLFKRQEIARQVLEALYRLAEAHERRGDYASAGEYAERQLALEPWRERAHRQLMRALVLSGQRGAALAQYEACRQALREELGVEPAAETTGLYARIRDGQIGERAPEMRGPPTSLHHFPAHAASFVGRERELAELQGLLADAAVRLVTVVGPGGMGKTRLALRAAEGAMADASGEACLVELAPVADDASVPRAVAAALGVQEQPRRALSETIADALQGRDLLLVVDNCEHVLDGAARLVDLLLARCPELTLLATSREPLRVAGEHLYDLPPMALPAPGDAPERLAQADAVRLFCARAAATRYGYELDGGAAAVAEVCCRLDGMPLAIELAAARLRALPLHEIARRLDDRFRLLRGGSRTALPRQRTLQDTVAWSYDLLDEDERALFDRLSIFWGSFSLAAVEAVSAGGAVGAGRVLDLLAGLVDKSLVAAASGEGAARFRLLETLRHYGAERLAARGEADEMAARHARFYASLAEAEGPALEDWEQEPVPALERLDAERENLAAVMRWSLVHGQPELAMRLGGAVNIWARHRWYLPQYAEWLRSALEQGRDAAPVYRCKALSVIFVWALHLGRSDDLAAAAEETLALARRAGDPILLAMALYMTGIVVHWKGQDDKAQAYMRDALELAREHGSRRWVTETSRVLAMYEKPARRRVILEVLLARAPHVHGTAVCGSLGWTLLTLGELKGAELRYWDAFARWGALGHKGNQGVISVRLARIAALRGDYARSLRLLEQDRDLCRQVGLTVWLVGANCEMGDLAGQRGDHETAVRLYTESLALARQHAFDGSIAASLVGLARVACERGEYERAEATCSQALDTLVETPNWLRGSVASVRARVALCRGHAGHAVALYREGLRCVLPEQDRTEIVEAAEYLAWALAADGRCAEAARLLAFATHQREDMGIVLYPVDRPHHERALAAARAALDEAAFNVAWAQGEAWSIEDALTQMLGQDHPIVLARPFFGQA